MKQKCLCCSHDRPAWQFAPAYKYCTACRRPLTGRRKCRRCDEDKPLSAFTGAARRCDACKTEQRPYTKTRQSKTPEPGPQATALSAAFNGWLRTA